MNLDLYKYIYLVGAGGIGMSALARYFNMNRKMVYGYDKVRSNLCLELEDEGVSLRYQDNVSVIPEPIKSAKDKEVLVIYTPAVPENNKILSFFSTNGFMIFKRAEILGLISQDVFTIAVAGTHGKTTTSTMLAHILYQSGKEVTAFLGGISRNYDTNLLLANKMDFLIIKADEYDRSFLELNMDIAIVTSVDPDHLDIYKDVNDLHKAFQEFVGLIKPNGFLLLEESIHIDLPVIDSVTKATYSVKHSAADYFSENIRIDNGKMIFDMVFSDNLFAIDSTKKEKDIELMMPGFHNISNALAAVAVACYLEVPFDNISRGLKNFRGIKRRFDTHIETNELVYIDDYAHHPEEISLTIDTAKQLYPLRHLSVVFHTDYLN